MEEGNGYLQTNGNNIDPTDASDRCFFPQAAVLLCRILSPALARHLQYCRHPKFQGFPGPGSIRRRTDKQRKQHARTISHRTYLNLCFLAILFLTSIKKHGSQPRQSPCVPFVRAFGPVQTAHSSSTAAVASHPSGWRGSLKYIFSWI